MLAQITQWCRDVAHLMFPHVCLGCEGVLESRQELLCYTCAVSLEGESTLSLLENESTLRLAGRFTFTQAVALGNFVNGGLLQHLLHQLKYNGRKELGLYIGKVLAKKIAAHPHWQMPDIITAVPLHKNREEVRGYNQAYILAQGLAEVLELPLSKENLKRVKATSSQVRKNRLQRMENVQDAFSISDPNEFAGKHVLLVDDVLTTGATLEACANRLLLLPGTTLSVCTAAVAVN